MNKNDTEKVSAEGRLMVGAMRVVKPLISNMTLKKKRTGHDFLGVIKGLPKSVHSDKAEACPLNAEWLHVENECSEAKNTAILFIHGGAYVTGSLIGSRPVAGLLCEITGIPVMAFEYRLAPEHTYPAALDDALKAWKYVLGLGIKAKNIAVIGESAGGGLAVALCLKLRDTGEKEMPGAVVCISPWADLTETSQSHIYNAKKDPILSSDELRSSAVKYSGGDSLKNPYISPVFADMNNMPPTLIHVGSREVLYEDAHMLYERYKEAGCFVQLSVYDGMWHVWHGFDIPESRNACHEIKDFLARVIEGDG